MHHSIKRANAPTLTRKLAAAIQASFPNLPATIRTAVELHVSLSCEGPAQASTRSLLSIEMLFAAAGHGWKVQVDVMQPKQINKLQKVDGATAASLIGLCLCSIQAFQQAFLTGVELPCLSVIYKAANGLMFFETVHPADLEQDLQDISSNPHLAKPTGNRGQSLPVMLPANPPAGKAVPLQAEVQQWMSNGSLDQLHATCHKDMPLLLRGPPELLITPHVSFGLQELHAEPQQQQQQQPNTSFWSATALGLPKQARQPFAALGATPVTPSQPSDEDEDKDPPLHQPYHFRQINIKNRGTYDVLLVDVRLSNSLPALPHTFAVLDDYSLSQAKDRYKGASTGTHDNAHDLSGADTSRQSCVNVTVENQSPRQKAPVQSEMTTPSSKGVLLSPGHEYQVTVALHCSDGSYRKNESGVLSQLVLFTFVTEKAKQIASGHSNQSPSKSPVKQSPSKKVPAENNPASPISPRQTANARQAPSSHSSPSPSVTTATSAVTLTPTSSQEVTSSSIRLANSRPASQDIQLHDDDDDESCNVIRNEDGGTFHAVVVARQVSVCLISKTAAVDQRTILDSDAKPFVPGHLKQLFETPASTWLYCKRPMDVLLGPQLMLHPDQTGPSWQVSAVSVPPGTAPVASSVRGISCDDVRKWSRMVRLEEAAMYDDIRRFDMFNVKLQRAVFERNQRRYSIQALLPGASSPPSSPQTHPYRGPALKAILSHEEGHFQDPSSDLPTVFMLQVPGLIEKRPNLNLGDYVYLRFASHTDREWCGWVVMTQDDKCMLAIPFLNPARDVRGSALVHVRFTFDRTPFKRMHQALLMAATLPLSMQLLPPTLPPDSSHSTAQHSTSQHGRAQHSTAGPASLYRQGLHEGSHGSPGTALPSDELFRAALTAAENDDQQVLGQLPSLEEVRSKAASLTQLGAKKLNRQQQEAVASVLVGAGGGAYPLALLGPPGTGKTVTLVECALQVYRHVKRARLLLCAPQNFSADLLFKALAAAGVTTDYMVRLVDPRIPPAQVQEDVRPFCIYNEDTNYFALPSPERLAAMHIVVCTCTAAGMLREGAYGAYHQAQQATHTGTPQKRCAPLEFTHIMIDEAGQALLPETLIPLTLLTKQGGCAMLCGDPRQLGPVLHSPVAGANGLRSSLLEAFVHYHAAQAPHMASMGLAPSLGMLVHNYRSHSRLLELPSRLYYDDALVASADPQMVAAPLWDELQDPDADPHQDEGLSNSQEHASHLDDGSSSQLQHLSTEHQPHGTQMGAAQLSDKDWQKAEGRGLEQVETAEADEGDDGEYNEEEGDSSLTQLPVNTLFYGVRGQQMREGEAASWHNPVEASALVALVQGLLAFSSPGRSKGQAVGIHDIGVIATYRQQVKKLRLLLRERGLGAVRVGTVDDFQGQEARIVFISTVLSRPEKPLTVNAQEVEPGVGFFKNPNRFNVAITRAQALMVVLGHPLVLLKDANWSELVRYCAARGAYKGAGAESLSQLTRGQFSHGADLPDLPGHGVEADSLEIQEAVSHMAEAALLGVGDASTLYPESLDEMYASYGGNDMEFRVAL